MNRKSRVLVSLVTTLLLSLISVASSMAGDPTGRWKGEWVSRSTGHKGPMRANVWQTNQGTYNARFSGRFAVIIPFTYKVSLSPTFDHQGNIHLYANKPLGPLLGSYTMNAMVSGNGLNGSFQAAKDVGSIRMQRIR